MKTNWPVKKLGELIVLNYGKGISEGDRKADGLYAIYGANGELGRTDKYLVDGEAIIVGRKGSAGEVTRISGKFWPSDVTYYVFGNKKIDIDFLFYLFKNINLKRFARGVKPGINRNDVYSLEIPVPGIEEQRRIVKKLEKILAKIDGARTLRQQSIEETETIVKSAIYNYFSGVLAQKEKLRDVAFLERGKFTPRPRNNPSYFGGSTPWIQIGEVTDREGKYINNYSGTLNERGVAVSKVFPAGTAVVSIAASIGTVGILNFDSAFPDSLIGIRGKEVLNDYVYYYLQFMQSHLDYIAPQSAQKNINLKILGDLEIPVPDLREQEKIVAYLDGLSEKVQVLQKLQEGQLQELELLKQSLLHQAFNGQI